MTNCIPVIEIGVTALRDPITREFLPAEPLYIERTEAAAECEDSLMHDVQRLFAHRIKQYMDECGQIGDKAIADALRPDTGQLADPAASGKRPHPSRKKNERKKRNERKTSL